MRKVAVVFGLVVGLFLVFRAVVEPFVIDMSDPATYQHDWGGPSLLGVLLVHMGPGALCAALLILGGVRWRRKATAALTSRPSHSGSAG